MIIIGELNTVVSHQAARSVYEGLPDNWEDKNERTSQV